ncbi:MAG: hypothetical protein ABJA35_13220 [Parafilimonas sp.]
MKIVTTLFLLFFFYSVNAQEGNQFNPCTNFCSDLSTPKTSYLTDELTYYKAGSDNTCGSSTFNSFDVQYLKNSCGENAEHCTSNLCNLKIHVFYPSGISVNCKLPAVILFHGGAYNECGDYNDGGIIALAENFAVRGFVAFDVNYRVGVLSDPRLVSNLTIPDNNPVLKYVSAQQMLAIYRALQDAHGAIRSILTMQLDGTFLTKNKYQIDINKVFLGGVSAGSLIAFGAEYLAYDSPNQTKIDALFPNVSTALGPIDLTGVYYANKPANINQDYFGKIKGILNCWGALFLPNANLSNPYQFFSGQGYTLPPVISFCGKNDTVFNYISQGVYFSPNKLIKGIALNTESYCLPYSNSYTVPPDNNLRSPIKYETCIGSQTIYYMLKNSGILRNFI